MSNLHLEANKRGTQGNTNPVDWVVHSRIVGREMMQGDEVGGQTSEVRAREGSG